MLNYQRPDRGQDRYDVLKSAVSQLVDHLRTPLYRNGYALMLNSVTTSLLGVGYWIFATRNYSTATVGLNSAAISAMMFLAGISQFNLGNLLLRFIPASGRSTGRFIRTTYLISAIAGAVLEPCVPKWLGALGTGTQSFGSDPALKGWFVAATVAWCIFALQDGALIGMRQATWVPVKNTVFCVAKIVLLIAFARFVPRYGLFASWTIGMLITCYP